MPSAAASAAILDSGPSAGDVRALAVDPTTVSTVCSGLDSGLVRTINRGKTTGTNLRLVYSVVSSQSPRDQEV